MSNHSEPSASADPSRGPADASPQPASLPPQGELPSRGDRPAEIVYRLATAEDIPRLLEMLESFVRARKLLRRTPEEIAVLTRHGFIAEADSRIVGFAAIEIYSRKLAEIQSLAVAEDFQNRGIGRRLVMQCLDRARELDVMEVLAISASDDFLRSCGFDYSLPDQKRALFCQLRPRGD